MIDGLGLRIATDLLILAACGLFLILERRRRPPSRAWMRVWIVAGGLALAFLVAETWRAASTP